VVQGFGHPGPDGPGVFGDRVELHDGCSFLDEGGVVAGYDASEDDDGGGWEEERGVFLASEVGDWGEVMPCWCVVFVRERCRQREAEDGEVGEELEELHFGCR